MYNSLSYILSLLVGATLMINGTAVNIDELLGHTQSVVNQANVHQIATVLELYNLDHDGVYPEVEGGEALINTLQKERYIRNRPINPSVFHYTTDRNGRNYTLEVIE